MEPDPEPSAEPESETEPEYSTTNTFYHWFTREHYVRAFRHFDRTRGGWFLRNLTQYERRNLHIAWHLRTPKQPLPEPEP